MIIMLGKLERNEKFYNSQQKKFSNINTRIEKLIMKQELSPTDKQEIDELIIRVKHLVNIEKLFDLNKQLIQDIDINTEECKKITTSKL